MYFNLNDNDFIKTVIHKSFPEYTGRNIRVCWGVSTMNLASWWSGGSINKHCIVELSTMKTVNVPEAHPNYQPEAYAKYKSVELKEGYVVVTLKYFGSQKSIEINTPSANTMLDSGNDGVSDDIKLLLIATTALKSSYGSVADLRKQSLIDTLGWSSTKVDELRIEAINLGLLAKNKSITISGKNAIENHPKRRMHWR